MPRLGTMIQEPARLALATVQRLVNHYLGGCVRDTNALAMILDADDPAQVQSSLDHEY